MEISQVYSAHGYAVPSPCGTYIASLSKSQDHIYVQWTGSLFPAFTFTLRTTYNAQSAPPSSDLKMLKWSSDSTSLLLISASEVRLFSLTDTAIKRHVSNGSGSLGKIIAAEVLGDYLIVASEFGTVQQWNVSSGKGSECKDVRIDEKGRPMWAICDAEPSVMASLAMINGQEVLSFRLAAQTVPFKKLNAASSDTRMMKWSEDGKWFATLESEMASQSVHVYTADGHFFRSYPSIARGTSDSCTLGFTTMRWSHSALLLASPRRSTTALDAQTISHKHTYRTTSCPDLSGWQEEFTNDKNTRNYRFVTRPSIPNSGLATEASDIEVNGNGTLFAAWNTETVTGAKSLMIWDLEMHIPCAVLMLQTQIRAVHWHPFRWDIMLVLCQDGSLRTWSLSTAEAPMFLACPVPSTAEITRVQVRWAVDAKATAAKQTEENHDAVLVSDRKLGWTLVWPWGKLPCKTPLMTSPATAASNAEEDVTDQEDSLMAILSGKNPLPELIVPMLTIDDETTNVGIEDTFDMVKHRPPVRVSCGSSEMF